MAAVFLKDKSLGSSWVERSS